MSTEADGTRVVPEDWMMGCHICGVEVQSPEDGVSMPEGWGFVFDASAVNRNEFGFFYACPAHADPTL